MTLSTDVHPTSVDQIQNWDYAADVIVAGYGIAGASAAVEAAATGADVLVICLRMPPPRAAFKR